MQAHNQAGGVGGGAAQRAGCPGGEAGRDREGAAAGAPAAGRHGPHRRAHVREERAPQRLRHLAGAIATPSSRLPPASMASQAWWMFRVWAGAVSGSHFCRAHVRCSGAARAASRVFSRAAACGFCSRKTADASGGAAEQAAYGKLQRFKIEVAAAVSECDRKVVAAEDAEDANVEPLERENLEGGEGDEWLLVTRPMQLAAVDGHVRLRRGLDKSTLPGFAELNPGGRNMLYLLYKFHGKIYELEGVAPSCSSAPMWHALSSLALCVGSVG